MNLILKNIQNKGFTLVETLVAITVLLLVIIGPMTIAQKGIQNAYYANDQITAMFLAQEAIEGVRELRDEKALEAYNTTGVVNTWDWIPAGCNAPTTCGFQGVTNPSTPITLCSNLGGCVVRKNTATNLYSHTPGDPVTSPQYTREITFDVSGTIDSVKVTVDVYWNASVFGGGPRHVILQTWLYDHYQRYE